MMSHSLDNGKLRELLIRLVENDINDEGVMILNQWLENNPDAVAQYCSFLSDYAIIRLRVSSSIDAHHESSDDSQFDQAVWAALKEAEDTAPVIAIQTDTTPSRCHIEKLQPVAVPRKLNKNAIFMAGASIAAMLFIMVLIHFLPQKASRPVASVTGNYNTQWSGAGESILTGSRLWNDQRQYHLDRGVAKITFDSGAEVLIEAPAQLQFISENELLFEGSLTADVPLAAHGFTVRTPHSQVVDLGTRFGLLTNADQSQLHVLKGNVELSEATVASQKRALTQLVQTGQSYEVNQSGTISEVPFRGQAFRWECPDSYEQAVYSTKPVNYWRFDRDSDEKMVNEMQPENLQGCYYGSVQLDASGPDLGNNTLNRALKLSGLDKNMAGDLAAGFGIMNAKGETFKPTGNYSVVMWILPEAFGVQSIFFNSGERPDGGRTLESYSDQIYLNKTNQISFYVYCSQSAQTNQALQSVSASDPVRLNTWYHVAACYSQDGSMKLYVNGQLKAAKRLPSTPETYRMSYVGCATVNPLYELSEDDHIARQPFTGTIDEISQYDRELSAQEIEVLYRAAAGPIQQ